MSKTKLRGLKLLEGGAQVVSSSRSGGKGLAAGVCSTLALNRINLTFLAHVRPDDIGGPVTALLTEGSEGRAATSLIATLPDDLASVEFHGDVSTLSIFPHGARPRITGELLTALAKGGIPLRGLASSPSAISSVVPLGHTKAAIDALFGAFEFPAYGSPSDWYAAYEGKEHLLKKIIASYQEQVVRIYDIVERTGLDLWGLVLPASDMDRVGAALEGLGSPGPGMHFAAGLPMPDGMLRFSFSFPSDNGPEVERALSRHLPAAPLSRCSRVAALFIHGPHFGDRYGIAHTFIDALKSAGVSLLALGCTVSSISAIIRETDLAAAVRALDGAFQRSSKDS